MIIVIAYTHVVLCCKVQRWNLVKLYSGKFSRV